MTSSQLRAAAKAAPTSPARTPLDWGGPQVEQFAASQSIVALPQAVNLTLYQGDDFYLDLVITNSDGSNTVLTGATATAQIRTTPGATAIMASMTSVIVGNVITLHLPHTDATALVNGVWDAQLIWGNGDIVTLVAGTVTVSAEVTRP